MEGFDKITAFETLVRLQREKLEKEVAGVLFP